MTCQRHYSALIDLAASGSEPTAELRTHLQACPHCHAALQRERALFASIDSSLRASTNAEVPTAFVQRVRAVVNQQPAASRVSFVRPRVVFAVAAAVIILFSFAHFTRRTKFGSAGNSIAQHQPSPEPVLAKPPDDLSPASVTASNAEARGSRTSTGNLRQPSQSARRHPEILVPNDQEILLARYAQQLRHRNSLPTLASSPASETGLSQTTALQFSPIQIAQLDVKPLEERQE